MTDDDRDLILSLKATNQNLERELAEARTHRVQLDRELEGSRVALELARRDMAAVVQGLRTIAESADDLQRVRQSFPPRSRCTCENCRRTRASAN